MQQLRYIKRELNLERDDKQSIIQAFKASKAIRSLNLHENSCKKDGGKAY